MLGAIVRLCEDIANNLSSTNFCIHKIIDSLLRKNVRDKTHVFNMYCTLQQHVPSGLKRTVYENTQISEAAVESYRKLFIKMHIFSLCRRI